MEQRQDNGGGGGKNGEVSFSLGDRAFLVILVVLTGTQVVLGLSPVVRWLARRFLS